MNDLTLPQWSAPDCLDKAKERLWNWGRSLHEHAYRMGRELIWIKEAVGHGDFGRWLKENTWFSQSTAERRMKFSGQCQESGTLLNYHPRLKIGTVTNLPAITLADAYRSKARALLDSCKKERLRDPLIVEQDGLLAELADRKAEWELKLKSTDIEEIVTLQKEAADFLRRATENTLRIERALGKILNEIPKEKLAGFLEFVNLPEEAREELIIGRVAEILAADAA